MKMSVAPDHAQHPSVRAGGAFQQPQRGRADGDDTPALRACVIEKCGRLFADMADFLMHAVLGRILRLDRQECPRPDMQRHESAVDAGGVECLEQALGEMQAGRRRGDRAFLARIDRLVVLAVALVFRPLGRDIGRQGYMADQRQRQIEIAAAPVEPQFHFPLDALGRNLGLQVMPVRAEFHDIA